MKDLFSSIPAKENPAERVYYPIEDSKELGYVVAKDKEAQGVGINWIFRHDVTKVKDEAYMRKDMAGDMLSSMLNNRCSELTRKPDCPALGMGIGFFSLARTKDASYLAVSPKEHKEKEAFALLITEVERARRFGFNESELERVKTSLLRRYESYEKEYAKVDNETWAEQLAANFLDASPFPSLEWEMNFAKKTIPSITLDEVNALLKDFTNIDNSVITITGPDKEDVQYPTKEELLEEIKAVEESELTAYVDEASDIPLVTDQLEDKKVVSESAVKGTDAKMYILENGARVVVYPTELSKDEILFSAYSFGGSSLLKHEQLESGDMATTIAGMSGLGEFNAVQLKKKLTGKLASVSPSLDEYTEGFSGSASPQDFETMLQLLYLKFTHPRFEEETFQTIKASLQNQLSFIAADNNRAFRDTIGMVESNYSPRNLIFNKDFVDHIDFEKAKAIYKDRFQDADDFTFIFVGNINVEKDLPLIAKYIGNIPTTDRKESWVNHHIKPAKGYTARTVKREMEFPKATVYYSLINDVDYSLQTRTYVRVIAELLSKRYLETIREEEGGSYGVSVRPSISKRSYEHASITMYFDCDPEKMDKLIGIMKNEIDNMVKNGVKTDDLEEIKKNYLKSREESENENSFWLSVIQGSLMNDEPITDSEGFNKIVNDLSAKSVQKYAKKLFKGYDSVEVVMIPEED